MNKEKLGPKVYGFWHYDKFPYVLGATGRVIREGHAEGCFHADGYGGAAFANPKIVSLKKGKEIKQKLDALEGLHNAVTDGIFSSFMRARSKIIRL